MDENHSKAIRAKFTTEDIQLATARAEKFLAGYGVQTEPLTAYEIIKMLADYDLNQLDEMFSGVEVGE